MKAWKNSASIIILVKNPIAETQLPNYKILLQKRSKEAKFLPNAMVFPGGATSECDSHQCWTDHFKSFGLNSNNFATLHNPNFGLTQIFKDECDVIHRHVSLRITAIRETFEELGILICKNRKQLQSGNQLFAPYITASNIRHWQEKVHHDPKNFLTLCKELDCYPDIWSLYLWSNWLTPIKITTHRFDTVFFVVAFEDKPPIYIEEKEVADVSLTTAEDVLIANEKKEVEMIFPQWYELSRFRHQPDIERLVQYAAQRSPLGCHLMFPIRQKIKDGILGVLPGDELYPSDPDFLTATKLCDREKTFEELRTSATSMHRIEVNKNEEKIIQIKNHTIPNFQLSPIDGNIPKILGNSHL